MSPPQDPTEPAAAAAAKPRPRRAGGSAKVSSSARAETHNSAAEPDAKTVDEKVEDVFRAFDKGREDAIEAAAKVAPGIKRAAAKSAYMFCYYLAFGAVYSAELVMSLASEDSPIRHGFADGADAAKAAHAQHESGGAVAEAG